VSTPRPPLVHKDTPVRPQVVPNVIHRLCKDSIDRVSAPA
jgi:hypothetical protein